MQLTMQDLEEQLEEEEASRQKLQLEKVALDTKVKKLEEDFALLEDSNNKVLEEKKALEERQNEVSTSLSSEEEKTKHLNKHQIKHFATIAYLEERLKKEQQVSEMIDRQSFN